MQPQGLAESSSFDPVALVQSWTSPPSLSTIQALQRAEAAAVRAQQLRAASHSPRFHNVPTDREDWPPLLPPSEVDTRQANREMGDLLEDERFDR